MLDVSYDKFWEKVIDTMMEGLMVVDTKGIIRSVNQALEQISGYSRQELLGQPCSILKCDTCYGRMTPGNCTLFKKGEVQHCRCVLAKKDGSPLHVLKNAVILKDANGKIVGGVETLTDLTDAMARENVICRLRQTLSRQEGFHGLLGRSPVMVQLFNLMESAAQSEAPVLIQGESGTGKELVAAAIHRLSPRRKGPFIKVNIAALNESLLESELFGHVKGAFTGADRLRVGRFEAATGGDIFLDEIGDLPLTTQAKLLRVLQEKVIEKVGDHSPLKVNVRIITATNQDLHRLMAAGRFREDLYYRIGVIPIQLPPLRQRLEDLPLLLEAFIEKARLKTPKPVRGISKEALDLLLRHSWPGNVRELINVVEYALVLCAEGLIGPGHLPSYLQNSPPAPQKVLAAGGKTPSPDERQRLLEVVKAVGGRKSEAARVLGISRVTLWKRLKAYDIQVEKVIRE